MPEYTPNAKGPAPARITPEATGPVRVPLSEVKPEEITPLAIEYRDGKPVIVVGSGTVLPAGLTAVNHEGKTLAIYTANDPRSAAAQNVTFGWQVNAWGVGNSAWV
ncbi:hypothetical protein, partial [Streptomyces sp. NPDC005989]|uniref:hypothetical protein n=1 Tax=Streptomyces sp. NPDC005989 TaxID=3156727 RepID=UPI003407D9F5